MYTLISGSPKVRDSNSMKFLNMIVSNIDGCNVFELKNGNYEGLIESIRESDVIVLAFPLYVDSPTSITLAFLDYLIDNKIILENKLIYVIINCGFRESKHNLTAVNIIKRWCEKVSAIYAGGILIGAGEVVGKDKYRFISHDTSKKLNYFSFMVKHKRKINDINTTMDLVNNRLYCFIANLSWTKSGKKNKLSKIDLRTK